MKAPRFNELKDFTLKGYVKLLRYLNQIYRIVPFREIPMEDIPYLILRHDIDVSLRAALKMAQIEKDMGVRSTYFVLFSSQLYNVLESNNVSILKQISKLGHEIGLHYDILAYRSYGQNMKETLAIEIRMLERLVDRKVYSICRHGTVPRSEDPFANLKGYTDANDPRLRDLLIYEGDKVWSQSISKLFSNPPRRVQLVIHPCHWLENTNRYMAVLWRFLRVLRWSLIRLREFTIHLVSPDWREKQSY